MASAQSLSLHIAGMKFFSRDELHLTFTRDALFRLVSPTRLYNSTSDAYNNTTDQHVCFFFSFILITITESTKMPELPPEIWTIIAKHVKREPPTVGQPGNWNDDFNQQDLTSLMRVNRVSLPERNSLTCRLCIKWSTRFCTTLQSSRIWAYS
jgi:hypothetical protein